MRLPVIALLLAAMAGPAAACGTTETCGDVGNDFAGWIIGEGVRLAWSTDSEDSTVGGYRILRYNCTSGVLCYQIVATIARVGDCNEFEEYEYTDYPAEPLSQWSYRIEVLNQQAGVACSRDTVPQ